MTRLLTPILAGALILLSAGTRSGAQDFPPGGEKIFSADRGYYAVIVEHPMGTSELRVFDSQIDMQHWRKWIERGDGDVVMLSNDGNTFVVINREYSEEKGLVRVYGPNSQMAFTVRNIVIPKELLHKESMAYLWFDSPSEENRFIYDENGKVSGLRLRLVSRKTIQLVF